MNSEARRFTVGLFVFVQICEEEIEFLTKGEDYVNLGLFASGGPYTNQGDDLSHGKRLKEVIWRLLQILKELLLSCARSTSLNRLARSSLESVGLQRQREGVAANAQPREQREEFVPVERDSRVLHPSRKNGAKWYCDIF
ncbi:hypothetical protein HID58_072082 [Brassica napus]|uniref:Uncharacterized protein n=1 Tax=Brassica napus TaxID=3708 RepID=A0ABQ7Z3M0_BRANA|nr:hypothetical protein HID58_072082 [Brassica napus]